MARVIAIVSPSGGSGKTSAAVNLGALLALAGRRTLLVDLDPQGGATVALGRRDAEAAASLRAFAAEGAAPPEPLATEVAGFDLVPMTAELYGLESTIAALGEEARPARLRAALAPLDEDYAVVLLDGPPGLGPIPLAMVGAADAVLVPIAPAPGAREGIARLEAALHGAPRAGGRGPSLVGFLLTHVDPASAVAREVEGELRAQHGRKVLGTVVPRDEAVLGAARAGRPLVRHRPDARATWAYIEIAKEVMDHERVEHRA